MLSYGAVLVVGEMVPAEPVPATTELAGRPELTGVWDAAGGAEVASGTLLIGRVVPLIGADPVALGPASPVAAEPLGPAVGNVPVAATPL